MNNWVEFLLSLFVLELSFHVMLRIARRGNSKKTIYGYFLYNILLIVVLAILCFVL